jgi:glutamate dehydrogenase (NAD(P)+)
MAWFMDTYSMYQGKTVTEIVTGKPVGAGGTVGRREATGRGVVFLVERALARMNRRLAGATAIVQGFGNVGSVAAASLVQRGAVVTGVSDHTAAYYDPRGLDVPALLAHAGRHGVLRGFAEQLLIDPAELLVQPCDILVPAALERVITAENAGRLRCRVLAEGANGPTTPEADRILAQRADEIFVIPDILCNAGGVIVSYFEWVQDLQQFFWDEAQVIERLENTLERSFRKVLARAASDQIGHRDAALAMGVQTIARAKQVRGLFP